MRAAACVSVLAAALAAAAAPASAAQVRNYDLGPTTIPDRSQFGPLPIRLWGAIGVPDGPGPHPLVLVLHGRHGTGCPLENDFGTWPCFDLAPQRNDLGLRHVVRALAERGVAALAPDLNGAFTEGWGEPDDRRRWPRIVTRTLRAVAADAAGRPPRFPLPLAGRLDMNRLGMFGHSLSGHRVVRASRNRPVRALFLLAPVFARAEPPPAVPFAVAVGSCDNDTGVRGRGYFEAARRDPARRAPAWIVRLRRANHNFYNRTLARLGLDDARGEPSPCRRSERPAAAAQQRFAAGAAADFFAATLRGARRPAWLRFGAPPPRRLHGVRVRVRRDAPGL